MPAAQALAKTEGFSANTSVWIGAVGRMLNEERKAEPTKMVPEEGEDCQKFPFI